MGSLVCLILAKNRVCHDFNMKIRNLSPLALCGPVLMVSIGVWWSEQVENWERHPKGGWSKARWRWIDIGVCALNLKVSELLIHIWMHSTPKQTLGVGEGQWTKWRGYQSFVSHVSSNCTLLVHTDSQMTNFWLSIIYGCYIITWICQICCMG